MGYFEQYNLLAKELYELSPQQIAFKNGLAISYSKLGETYSVMGDMQQALTFFEDQVYFFEELYEAHPQQVALKNGLAISYRRLGVFYQDQKKDPAQAKPWLEQCHRLWKELSEAYPAYAEFQENFRWAVEALEKLK